MIDAERSVQRRETDEVLRSVKCAGLATEVAQLKARFVIKDGDKADD